MQLGELETRKKKDALMKPTNPSWISNYCQRDYTNFVFNSKLLSMIAYYVSLFFNALKDLSKGYFILNGKLLVTIRILK